MRDPYLYPNSEVLRNLADIHDEKALNDMEADYTLYRLSEVVTDSSGSRYGFEALCEMHRHIFQDVFEWAGKPRVINIEKAEVVLGELSIEYTDCFDIERVASHILKGMNDFAWEKADFLSVAEKFSECLAQLWKVHPYREGNTRTIVTFCSMFIESRNIYIESELFKDNSRYMRDALVAANAVFRDMGDLRKPEYLNRIVQDALAQGQEMKERVSIQIEEAGILLTNENIRQVVFWNRKEKREHSAVEIQRWVSAIRR